MARKRQATPENEENSVRNLSSTVQSDKTELIAQLRRKQRLAEKNRIRRRDDISKLISQALGPTKDIGKDFTSYPGTSIALNPNYVEASTVLKSSHNLVNDYDRVEKMIQDAKQDEESPITETWRHEVKEVKRTLQLGRNVATSNVKKVLGATTATNEKEMMMVSEASTGAVEEDGVQGIGSMEATSETQLDYGLLRSLRYAERGVKRMIKGLPRDEVQ